MNFILFKLYKNIFLTDLKLEKLIRHCQKKNVFH